MRRSRFSRLRERLAETTGYGGGLAAENDLFVPFAAFARTNMKSLLILVARGWQAGPSRILPPSCRYTPSCSQYAIDALEKHGVIKGGWLATKRLLRCHPWGGHGFDPVP